MDTLLSGLIPGLIGACATILAAFISRSYANAQIDTTPPAKPLGRVTMTLIRALSKISIRGAYSVTAKLNQAVVLDWLDLIVCFRGYTYTNLNTSRREITGLKINLTLPGGDLKELSEINPGWSVRFDRRGERFQIILISYELLECRLQIRKIPNHEEAEL